MDGSRKRPDTKDDTPVVPQAAIATTAAATTTDTNIPAESDLRNVKTTTTAVAAVNATPSVTSTFVCEFCEEKFTSRNSLFQHLRGNKNDKTKKRGHHNKKSKQSNDVHIVSQCQRVQQQRQQQYTTTTNSTTTALESDTGNETSLLTTAPTSIPLPPSIMKKQQRQIQLAQEKLLRNANKRKSRPSTGVGTNTAAISTTENHAAASSASSSMLWMGDLPLLWTTRQRNYQRLRMLLRAHVPRSIPTPHIKLVHRKAYRSHYKNDVTRQSQGNISSTLAHTATLHCDDWTLSGTTESTDRSKINNETLDDEKIMTEDSTAGLHRTLSSPQQEEEPCTVDSNQNSDVNDNNPYLGYAILVFRDEEECTTVLRELDQREVTLQSVFSTTDDIEQNKDFYNLIHSNNENSGTFRIKVRPVDHHHTIPKQQLDQHNLNVATTDSNDASTMAIDRNVPQVDQDSIGTANKPTLGVSGQDPPIIDRLQPLSTEVLIQRIQALGGDTSTLTTTISPESLLSLSSTKSTTTNKKSDSDSSQQQTLMTILQDQHDRALQHAVQVYQTYTPKITYHEGRLIPTHLRDKLLSLLTNLRWAVPNQRTGMNTERYLVLLSNVQNDAFYSDIRNACKELMTSCTNDPSFYYSGIAITKNFVGSPHIDDRDQTYQYALSLGNFTHGGELCVDGGMVDSVKDNGDTRLMTTINSSIETNHLIDPAKATAVPAIHVINTHNRIARVDGRHVHWVRTWENRTNSSSCDRYSLIFYDTSTRCPTPVVNMTNFSIV